MVLAGFLFFGLLFLQLSGAIANQRQPTRVTSVPQNYDDEPVQLIYPDHNHNNLFLKEETVNLLKGLNMPLAVVGGVLSFLFASRADY